MARGPVVDVNSFTNEEIHHVKVLRVRVDRVVQRVHIVVVGLVEPDVVLQDTLYKLNKTLLCRQHKNTGARPFSITVGSHRN